MNFIHILLGGNDDFLRGREAYTTPVDTKINIVPEKFRTDVKALTDYIGKSQFKSGLCIDVSLSGILSVVPRKRRRVDAYNTLIKFLKDEQNIILTIKTKSNEKN